MSQHFLLSRTAKSLILAQVMRMTDEEAETMFARIRWPDTNGDRWHGAKQDGERTRCKFP